MDEIDTSQQNTSNDDAESNDEHVSTKRKQHEKKNCAFDTVSVYLCCQKMSSSYRRIKFMAKKNQSSFNFILFRFLFLSELSFGYIFSMQCMAYFVWN